MYLRHEGTTPRQAHVGLPEGSYEEEQGRLGFFGPVSHLYHLHPPTEWTDIDGPLKPRAFDFLAASPRDATMLGRVRLLENEDLALAIARPTTEVPWYLRNADGDEILFIHQGSGRIITEYGVLEYEEGDYLLIPRCTSYRVIPTSSDQCMLIIEARSLVSPPSRELKGLVGVHALFDASAIIPPSFTPSAPGHDGAPSEVRILRDGMVTRVTYPFDICDAVGWKGDCYPWKINVRDIRPLMSHRVHLPPPAHTTFLMHDAVVCTFLPRPLEEDPDCLKIPFFHRNCDYDEVIFYHSGNFFSRDNIRPGMVTFHPTGIHHGPHPRALANMANIHRADEVAVMVDTVRPLRMTEEAANVEWEDYWKSWGKK